ncbi:MAG: PAS domain S-box protein [Gammaproteobacteria bacterium]|nr:PAS domain S-box protein [Gammaproteobacteria bacterium]
MSVPIEDLEANASPRPGRLIALISSMALAVAAVGYYFYDLQEASLRRQIEQRLAAVAQVNSERVAQWRRDQWVDAGILAGNPFLADGLTGLWNNPNNELAAEVDAYLRHVQREHDYADILIVDRDGRVRHFLESDGPLPRPLAVAVDQVIARKERVFVDELESPNRGGVPFATIAPLYTPGNEADETPSGALVLINDVDQYLYPLIESWPTPSETGETLLVKREAGHATVLNRATDSLPEHPEGPQPVDAGVSAGISASLDRHHVVASTDYRGVQVVAAVAPIADTGWVIVSKQDASEAFAPWHVRSLLILALLGALVLSFGVMGFVFWHRQRRRHFRELYQSETHRRLAAERYGIMLRSIADGVIVTDDAGHVEFLNDAAESLTGWTDADARGKPLQDVFRIYDGQTRTPLESPFERVRRTGVAVGLAADTWLVSLDGSERPIADSSAPVRDASGNLTGAVLVFQDQTKQQWVRRELEASEARYRFLIESAPEAIFVQVGGRFAYLNTACLTLFGASDENELVGQPTLDRFHPAYHESVQERRGSLRDERQPVGLVEEHLVALSGDVIPAEVSAVPIDYEGQPGALVFARDISVRKAAEAAVQSNLAMLERTERIARVGSWEWDIAPDTVHWSTELYRIFGLSPSAPAPPFAEHSRLFLPADLERLQAAVNRCIESAEPYTLELQILRADSSSRWCIACGEADFDEDGRVQRLVGSFQDVTERRQLEEALRQSEEKFRNLFNEHRAVKLLIDSSTGQLLDANKAAAHFYGWTVDELRGMNISQINELETEALQRELGAAERAEKSRFEFRHRKADGSVADVEVFVSRVTIGGEEVLHSIVHDVSEKRRIENELLQAQKMESVGRLAGGVAHDFNNMLSVILGHAQLGMEEVDPDSRLYADLDEIVAAAQRSTEIVRQLLTFARKQTINKVVLNLNEAVSNLLKMLHRLLGEDIDLVWAPDHELWKVELDPVQVDQILVNLCINARDAIDDVGRITIETDNVAIDEEYCADHPAFQPGD